MEFNWDLFNAVALHVQNDRNDELFASFDASRNFHLSNLSDSAIRIYCYYLLSTHEGVINILNLTMVHWSMQCSGFSSIKLSKLFQSLVAREMALAGVLITADCRG